MNWAKRQRAAIIALLAGGLIGAAANEALSRRELTSLKGREADRQFRRDLLSIVRPVNRYDLPGNRILPQAFAHTRATATEYRSLCQRDTLTLAYQATGRRGPADDWPMRPVGFSAQRYYRFVVQPNPAELEAADHGGTGRSAFDPECRAADRAVGGDEWTGWFLAPSPGDAMYGGLAMLALAEWARQPGNAFEGCAAGSNERVCSARTRGELNLARLDSIDVCAPPTAALHCLRLGGQATTFTVLYRAGSPYLRPQDIVSVKAEEVIIVT